VKFSGIFLLLICQLAARGQSGVTLTTLHSFSGSDGGNPAGGLVWGGDGNLYGTTSANDFANTNYGTVFMIAPDGAFTNLHVFAGSTDGAWPQAGLVQGADGNLYGTTYSRGANGWGTVFVIGSSGDFSTLVSFESESIPGAPTSVLVQGHDGSFYSMADLGGAFGLGTLFRVTPGGAVSVLISFDGASGFTGWDADALLQSADGNFYGATQLGGAAFENEFLNPGSGTVFKLTAEGTLTTLLSFSGKNGSAPTALVQGIDGNFYGTTFHGGSNYNPAVGSYGYGTVFKLATNGTLTTLASFNRTNGSSPNSLMQARDGNFYGATYDGGNKGYGTVFQVTPDGALASLVSFSRTNSANPYYGPLAQGGDGNFYGTTFHGGASNLGTVFRLSITPPQLSIIPAGANVILTWLTNATGFTLQSTTNVVAPAVWTNVSPGPTIIDGQNAVTNLISGTQQFYRLATNVRNPTFTPVVADLDGPAQRPIQFHSAQPERQRGGDSSLHESCYLDRASHTDECDW